MADLAEGKKSMTERNQYIADINLKKVEKYGFRK